MNYYNENDKFAAQWLRNLIEEKLIPEGIVDDRSIEDVQSKDLKEFAQCHFFAGIGGWAYALQLARWDSDRPVWTGSCPCQSFSVAGQRKGADDERNLWPQWFGLIRESRPATIFGEQVVGAIGFGWLDAVATDLEAVDYRFASSVLSGYIAGAYHRRQRLWFVADSQNSRRYRGSSQTKQKRETTKQNYRRGVWSNTKGQRLHMADSANDGRSKGESDTKSRGIEGSEKGGRLFKSQGDRSYMADTNFKRLQGSGHLERTSDPKKNKEKQEHRVINDGGECRVNWRAVEWVKCGDGKTRPIPLESDVQPLVNGIPEVMDSEGNPRKYSYAGSLKGIGNAIIPQVAAEFISAFLEIE